MKLDHLFDHITNGVITTDGQDIIVTLNRAAERILMVQENEVKGHPYTKALPQLGPAIAPLIETVKRRDEKVTGYEVELKLPQRGQTFLRLNISPLKNNHPNSTGVAIIVDDLTEQRQLARQVQQVRRAFERYISPRVVEQLLSDPSRLRLGGERREVSIFFADVRNFVAFSEAVEPEVQIAVLNRHLTLAAEAILKEDGTLDKFMGDALMAMFNAPHEQPDHVMRAIRAALNTQHAIAQLHDQLPPAKQLNFGIGIAAGPAIVGNIGADTVHSYTAVGDNVNMAYRLQAHAQPGQILIDALTYERIEEHVVAHEQGLAHFKGHSVPHRVFEILDLR
ncbi:MAG TPA: PAS domain S-box protein [Chloroflexi bacterium]|nr:PAS domain S-box protein [Chloroflexota bacterium]